MTIQIKATEQYFHVVLFIMPYKVVPFNLFRLFFFTFEGTGKTWTAVEIACQFAALNRKQGDKGQVLFCAPSNHAVDVAASKC